MSDLGCEDGMVDVVGRDVLSGCNDDGSGCCEAGGLMLRGVDGAEVSDGGAFGLDCCWPMFLVLR